VSDSLSTREVGWLLEKSPGAVREMIRGGEIEAARIPTGFRISREEARRLGRERIEAEAGRVVSDAQLDRLIDQVIETNEARTA
jgi:hypothetical protein